MSMLAQSSSTSSRTSRLQIAGMFLLAAIVVAAAQKPRRSLVTPHAPGAVLPSVVRHREGGKTSSSVLVDSRGTLSVRGAQASVEASGLRASSGLIRRQDIEPEHSAIAQPADAEARRARWWNMQASLLSGGAANAEAASSSRDLYVLIGSNLCDGGGLWKRYELNAVTPGKYEFCASACDAKDECVGFDVGNTGCNLYTQKAVAVGTWPSVRFNNAEPFDGEGDHDAYPQTPFDLTVGSTDFGANEKFQCYRKTYYKPSDSYYWLLGNGTCSGGGMWKRYRMSPGNYSSCENACNMRDECVGFDVGTWSVTDSTLQVYQDQFRTSLVTTTGCFMYTQKGVFGTWPGVQATTPEDGEGAHDSFPPTPFDLSVGDVARYNVGGATQCFGKTHWVNLDVYYMQLGQQLCSGGGRWKHYKVSGGTLQHCQDKCDMKDTCVGLDFVEGGACRLYTRVAVSLSSWEGVTFDGNGPFSGSGDHDAFPPTPFSLVPSNSAPASSHYCFAKTHFETPDQGLTDTDTR